MKLEQSCKQFNLEIELTKEFIEYHFKENKTAIDKFIKYETVSNSLRKGELENKGYLIGGISSVTIAFFIAYANDYNMGIGLFFFMASGVAAIWKFISMNVKYIIIDTEESPIILLDKPESHELFDEIKTIRNEKLRNNHLAINWDNAMESELNKFLTMKKLGAISENEYNEIKNQIMSK